MTKEEAQEIIRILDKDHPNAKSELDSSNPFELLIATILSAQTTDAQVNKATPALFEKYPRPEDLAQADLDELQAMIKNIGLYRNKSKNIRSTAAILVEKFDAEVPDNMEDLLTLPGVGRKTANVVLSNAFGVPSIAVDTHVFRVSNRLGLSKSDSVEECEKDLMIILNKNIWSKAHHLLILHGRYTCKARNPQCQECNVRDHCRYYNADKD